MTTIKDLIETMDKREQEDLSDMSDEQMAILEEFIT